MKLVTVVDVRLRKKKLAVSPEIDDALGNAIEAATVFLEGKLNTEFTQATLTHKYRVNLIEKPPTGQFSELFLQLGQVNMSTAPVVRTANRLADLDTGTLLTLDEQFHVEAEKGIILLDHTDSIRFGEGLRPLSGGFISGLRGLGDNFFVKVTYTAGFSNTGGLFDDVPEWLKEAAVVSTIIILEQQSVVKKKADGSQSTSQNQTSWNHLLAILDRRSRFFGATVKPLF